VPHPGLVSWWQFNEGTGTVAGDSSGNGNNGTIYGATWTTTGKFGNALSFNGVSNYVQSTTTVSYDTSANNYTISAWIYQTGTAGNTFNSIAGINMPGLGLVIATYSNNQIGAWANGNLGSWITVGDLRNTWHYVVAVFTQSSSWVPAQMYLDGVYVGNSVTDRTTPATGSGTIAASQSYAGYSTYFDGSIEDVQIYNRALSAAEIQTYYQQSPDFSSYLLAKIPMGTTQIITTLSWQGTGSINVTLISPAQNYTESMMSKYQKTTYSTTGGMTSLLNIKRLQVTVSALSTDQNWYILLVYDSNVNSYQISVETST
jgi:hypothetical protein